MPFTLLRRECSRSACIANVRFQDGSRGHTVGSSQGVRDRLFMLSCFGTGPIVFGTRKWLHDVLYRHRCTKRYSRFPPTSLRWSATPFEPMMILTTPKPPSGSSGHGLPVRAHHQHLMQQSIKQAAAGVISGGEARLQPVTKRYQFIGPGDNAVLFGKGWNGDQESPEPRKRNGLLGDARCTSGCLLEYQTALHRTGQKTLHR